MIEECDRCDGDGCITCGCEDGDCGLCDDGLIECPDCDGYGYFEDEEDDE